MVTFCPSSIRPSVRFQTTSLKPLSQFWSNFICSLPRLGERNIAKIVTVQWTRWPPGPYMVETNINPYLQNWGFFRAESLHKSLETGGLSKLLKLWSYITVWPFYDEVNFASLCICKGTIHLYGENVENFKRLLLWSCQAKVSQILLWSLFGAGEWKVLKWSRSIDQDGRHVHIYSKNL